MRFPSNLSANLLRAAIRSPLPQPEPSCDYRCSECGLKVTKAALNDSERFWRKNPSGAFGPDGGDPSGMSHDQICECGAVNSFEEIS